MDNRVRAFIDQKKAEKYAKEYAQKNDVLIRLGLYDKVYSPIPLSGPTSEYPNSEWDYNTNSYKYYRCVPFEVSDAEFEELLKYTGKSKETGVFANIGKKLKLLANVMFWLTFIGALVCGLIFIIVGMDGDDDLLFVGLPLLAIGPIFAWLSNCLLYGFGELIDKTAQIEKNTRK